MSKLPASLKAPPLNRLRAFESFTRDVDYIADRYDELARINRVADELAPGDAKRAALAKAAALSGRDLETMARCDQGFDDFNPPECYEDNNGLRPIRREVISLRIAAIVGSFPQGAPADPEIYVAMLIEQVHAVEGLTVPALDAACHQIIATLKFLPNVSEVLPVFREQTEKWDRRFDAACNLADWSRGLVAKIERGRE